MTDGLKDALFLFREAQEGRSPTERPVDFTVPAELFDAVEDELGHRPFVERVPLGRSGWFQMRKGTLNMRFVDWTESADHLLLKGVKMFRGA